MRKNNSFYDTVDQIVSYGIEKGILHLNTATQAFNGMHLVINNKAIINFGSCSYLGLEFHPALKEGAKAAIDRYGTQFSASRAYVSVGLYEILEGLLETIFEAPCVIAPTTTLGHIACIPVVVDDADAVILDQQVHNSVQSAVQLLKARGVHIELLRHNRMDLLEETIQSLRNKYRKIWYMADGIYSMFGDSSPVDTVYRLMDQYPELYYYVDDAHGMSIHGKSGRGYVLSRHAIHRKMIMATSLNKAFASGGGVLVFGDKETARKVGTVGGPLLSSGPMQPASLGADIAAANIHLGDEINSLQQQLKDNITFTRLLLEQYGLPVISEPGAAIFFVAVSLPKLGHHLVKKMLEAGFYVNLGVFPTVPMKQTGIRFTITRLHSFDDIRKMIHTLARLFPAAMQDEGITLPEIYKAFKRPMPEEALTDAAVSTMIDQTLLLETTQYHTIMDVPKELWNSLFLGKGSFDWDNLALLEESFSNNKAPEDNWLFDYIIVSDRTGKVIAASFFTTALAKDDMLSPDIISRQVETKRVNDPYFLTSKVISSGSMITEGEHLYIDSSSPLWKAAVALLLQKAYALQETNQANSIVLRDFHAIDEELDSLMVDNGFFRIGMPDAHSLNHIGGWDAQHFQEQLSYNALRQLKKKVLRNLPAFDIHLLSGTAGPARVEQWYQLYLQVKNKSFELNTFPLPRKFFTAIANSSHWEMMELWLKEVSTSGPVAVVCCHKSSDAYIPMVIGIDYTWNKTYNVYRQALYQVSLRAMQLGKTRLLLGFSADIEKQKMGAVAAKTWAYLHTSDSFNNEMLGAIPAVQHQTR